MEQAHRSAVEDNVHRRYEGMGTWVLINARWYCRDNQHFPGIQTHHGDPDGSGRGDTGFIKMDVLKKTFKTTMHG
ncbi:MAG: hypothetical protein CL726_11470 [Chloroflexi bacterium]|nr:hypothetical protein [Chloroflexota bacterium]